MEGEGEGGGHHNDGKGAKNNKRRNNKRKPEGKNRGLCLQFLSNLGLSLVVPRQTEALPTYSPTQNHAKISPAKEAGRGLARAELSPPAQLRFLMCHSLVAWAVYAGNLERARGEKKGQRPPPPRRRRRRWRGRGRRPLQMMTLTLLGG